MSVTPYPIMMSAEILVRNHSGTLMRRLDTLSRTVKTIMKNTVDPTMISGLRCLCVPSDHHRMTGSIGSTHGARTLSSPARNARTANDMSSGNSVKACGLF